MPAIADDRRVLLESPPAKPPRVVTVTADANDEFSVFLSSGQVLRFDAQNQLALSFGHPDLATFSAIWGGIRANGSVLGPLVFGTGTSAPGLPSELGPQTNLCHVHPLADGSKLTLFPEWLLVTRDRDGGGGVWHFENEIRLVRYSANCAVRRLDLQEFLPIRHLIAHPGKPAVFALSDLGGIHLAQADGLVWQSGVPDFSGFFWLQGGPAGVVADEALVVAYRADDGSARVAALDQDGDLAWTWATEPGHLIKLMQTYPSGVLLVTSDAWLFLDPHGQELWRHERAANGSFPDIAPARRDDRYAWLSYRVFPAGGHRIAALELTTGTTTEWSIDPNMSLAVGRDDGSAVVFDWQAFSEGGDELLLSRPDGSLEAFMPELKNEHRIASLHRDAHGVVVAGLGGRALSVQALNHYLQPQWSVARQDEEANDFGTLQLSGNGQLVCMLSDTRFNQPVLECFDRTNGRALFTPISWIGYRPFLHPTFDQGIEVMYLGMEHSGALSRRRFDIDGTLLETHNDVIASLGAEVRVIHQILYSPAGHTLIHYSERGDQGWIAGERLAILPPQHQLGTPFPTISLPAQFSSWSQAGDYTKRRFAMTGQGVAILSPTDSGLGLSVLDMNSGARLWRREFELNGWQPEFHIHAQGQDWMIALLDLNRLQLTRLAAADGATMLDSDHAISQHTRHPGIDELRLDALLLSDQRATAVVTARAAGTRVLWFDNDSGEFLAAAMDPLITAPSWVAQPGIQPGELLIAGQAAHPEWPALELVQLGVDARRPVANPDPQQFAGAWFNPATTGQGWFIDVLDGVDKIFGAWFTFDRWPASDPSGLRWYTMLGDLPGPDGVATLDLFGNVCGSFETAPPTEAILLGRVKMWPSPSGGLQMNLQWLWDAGTEWEEVIDSVLLDLRPGHSTGQPGGIQHWFDPAIAGQGLVLGRPLEDPGPLMVAWFTYDLPNFRDDPVCQHWFTALGPPSTDAQNGRQARLLQTLGGSMDGQRTRNTVEVGDIRLTPISCDQLLFEYEFDDSEPAGPYSGLSGQRVLRTAGSCPTP